LRENAGKLRVTFFGGEIVQIRVDFSDKSVESSLSPILRAQMKWSGVLSA
jgi:hypothetical protein